MSRPQTRSVLLVSLGVPGAAEAPLSLGAASLQASLHAAGVPTAILKAPTSEAPEAVEALASRILAWSETDVAPAQDLAIGVYVWNDPMVRPLLGVLRRRGFAGRIVLGGPQITYATPGVAALYPEADLVVRGPGEEALVALAGGARPEEVPGVVHGGVDTGALAGVQLGALPSPYLEGLLDVSAGGRVRWETKRNCPYRCAFCQHRAPDAHKRLASFSLERLEAELRLFRRRGVRRIDVLDPIFNVGRDHLRLTGQLADVGAEVSLQCRFETLRPEFLDRCAGWDSLLEFGLQTIHEAEGRAIDRVNAPKRVERGIEGLHARGISFLVSLIYGLPEQTLESFKASVAFCLEREVPIIRVFPLLLLRGTRLDRDAASLGLVVDGGPLPRVVRSPTFDTNDWAQMARLSEALRATEGHHPRTLDELERVAEEVAV